MEVICKKEFGGERPLFATRNLKLDNVIIHKGESALKECGNIEAVNCTFEGKYPFWHNDGFVLKGCHFTEGARAALWYSRNLEMSDTQIDAPKMFREMDNIKLENVNIPDAAETLWMCRGIKLKNITASNGDYIMSHCKDIEIDNLKLNGNYSFQYCKNVVIRNSVLNTKDAFWNSEDVTVYDSEINGEYLGWHSKNLHLVNCKISGTQPLCYAHNLIMENCTMADDADLAFESSTLNATIRSAVKSVKNPSSGCIKADSYGEIIIDENIKAPADCKLTLWN